MKRLHQSTICLLTALLLVTLFVFGTYISSFPKPTVLPGDQWYFVEQPENPFQSPSTNIVTVVEVREGWVKFSFNANYSDHTHARTIKDFTKLRSLLQRRTITNTVHCPSCRCSTQATNLSSSTMHYFTNFLITFTTDK